MKYYVEIRVLKTRFDFLIYPIKQFLQKKETTDKTVSVIKIDYPVYYAKAESVLNLPLGNLVVSNKEIFDNLSDAMAHIVRKIFEAEV